MKPDAEPFGLRTRHPGHRVALRGVRLRARLSGMSQRTVVEQTYVNLERTAIEAVYTFPLPESAAVCGFEVVTGDRVLTGTVEEAGRAIDQYDKAIGQGHGAFMAEEHRPDVFSVRVGNLLPRQALTVRLTYVCPLERADRSIRVAFPTTVAPRYVTESGTDPLSAMIDGDALNPPHVLTVPYGLTMEVDVDLGRPVTAITSPSHAIRVSETDLGRTRAFVTFAAGVSEMNRDVVLDITLPREHGPVVQAAAGPGGATYLAVTFVPEFDLDELGDPLPMETVFVLDCSGSMQGDSMEQATAALELCLRSLSAGDTFNVCRFGSTHDMLGREPLVYCDHTLRMALDYIRRDVDLGGTELYPALCAVLAPHRHKGPPRQVILLTDGQVGNEPACIELARKMRAHNRIFSFGIGTACSASLVKGLARATGGAAEFISPGERIDEKVLRTFGRLNSPVVTDATIDWDGCDVQTMAELPPVFDGVMTVFGRAPGKLPQRVTLSCRAPSSPVRWSMPVPAPADDGGVIATMWARRTIQSLEEVNDLHRQRYAGGTPSREAATLASLSKEFNLLSSLTAFVAIEHRSVEERNDGRPALRRVPVALADGWGGVRAGGILGDLRAAMCVMKRATTIDKTIDSSTVRSLDRTLDRSLERFADLNAHDTLKDLKARGDSVDLDAMDLDTLKDAADSSPIRKLVNLMLLQAIKENAGEILVEALDDCFRVTYVLNGVRRERDRMPLHIGKPVCRRLKVMACLDPIASRFPQEGAIELSVDGRLYRLEARFTPTARGRQSVALRVGRPADPAGTPAPEATAPAASASLPMHDLYAVLSTQSANGSFAPRDTVWNVLRADGLHTGGWPQEIERTAPAMAGGLLDRDAVVRTTVALLLLRRHFADQQALWRRAAGKAVTFLAHTFGCDVATVQAWLKELAARLMVAPVVPAAP